MAFAYRLAWQGSGPGPCGFGGEGCTTGLGKVLLNGGGPGSSIRHTEPLEWVPSGQCANRPSGSVRLTGSPPTYAKRFQLPGSEGSPDPPLFAIYGSAVKNLPIPG